MSQGRLSEIFGPETVSIDKYIRTLGLPRQVEHYMKELTAEDDLLLINYCAGVNKVVENLEVWPTEFYILQTGFEPWTAKDSVSIQFLMTLFVSTDWFFELIRERLTEVYEKELVDRLMPY